MTIPDISYHLIFCFLSLQELPLIAQSSKEWKRLVTAQSFLNMFVHKYKYMIDYKKEIFEASLVNSPFSHVIRDLIFIIPVNHNLELIYSIHQFKCIESLKLCIDFYDSKNREFDITPVFKALGPKLRKLTAVLDHVTYMGTPVPAFLHFQNVLSLLTSLRSLKLKISSQIKFTNISFLSHMNQLESFVCECISNKVSMQELMPYLRCCPHLIHLDLGYLFFNHRLKYLTDLYNSIQNPKLSHLGRFYNIDKNHELEYAKLLNQMVHIKTIDILIQNDHSTLPTLLGKWIQNLVLNDRKLEFEFICSIIDGLPHLTSLSLINCTVSDQSMWFLIQGLSSKLEILKVDSEDSWCNVPLSSLSNCLKLKSLKLCDAIDVHTKSCDFNVLTKCSLLESIIIKNNFGAFYQINLDTSMQKALKIPSLIFPKLNTVRINKQ
jgi:hypothetical protein